MRDSRQPIAWALAALVCTSPLDAAVTTRPTLGGGMLAPSFASPYGEAQGPEQIDRQVRTFKVGDQGALDLTNISGDVRVSGGGGNEIRIEATKRVRHRDADEAKRLLDQLRVEITQVGDRVEVRTIYPRRENRSSDRNSSASVDFVVSLPGTTAAAVKTISGDVTVENVKGEVRAETISGSVTVAGTPNLSYAKTVSGSVTARDIGGASALVLGTVSGQITATGIKARTVECGTISGDVRVSGVEVERLMAKSVSGDLEYSGTLARRGRYDFTSHSGDVRLILPASVGFELNASTFSGTVRSDIPVTLRSDGPVSGGGRASRSGMSNRTIRGSFGDASAILNVQSFSGSVAITKQ